VGVATNGFIKGSNGSDERNLDLVGVATQLKFE